MSSHIVSRDDYDFLWTGYKKDKTDQLIISKVEGDHEWGFYLGPLGRSEVDVRETKLHGAR